MHIPAQQHIARQHHQRGENAQLQQMPDTRPIKWVFIWSTNIHVLLPP